MGSVAWSSKSGVLRTWVFAMVAVVLTLGVRPSMAMAQDQQTPAQLLEDFCHYVTIANYELAAANAQALLDRGITPEKFLGMVEEQPGMDTRFDGAYRRAIVVPDLEDLAAELYGLYDQGRKARARNLNEINANIDKLGGTTRERIQAIERLKAAREYAVPSLLDVVLRGTKVEQRAGARALLIDMGRYSAVPLRQALLHLDPVDQSTVCGILGGIQDRGSIPFLYDLRMHTTSQPVRESAEDAIRRVDSVYDPAVSVAGLYRQLAERYLADRHARTLDAFPGEQHQLVWKWIKGIGLEPTAIDTSVYHEAIAMRLCERALELDRTDPVTLAVWIEGNFAREQAQPEGYDNPMYGPDRREAMFYAVASGAGPLQRVLARSLRESETVIARRSIEALSRSTGGVGLWSGLGEERPLVDAMNYSDRRVQYDAALALGQANPREVFTGADRVVPTLAALVRDAGARYAVVVADDAERQQTIRSVLSGAGYTVLAPARNLSAASGAIAAAPGVDLIVTELPIGRTLESIQEIRRTSRLVATPVIALVNANDVTTYRSQLSGDHLTRLVRQGVNASQLTEAASQLTQAAGGDPVTTEEAEAYALEALSTLNTIAVSGNEVLSVRDAAGALITALNETDGEIRAQVAGVLSAVGSQRAQQALFDAAVESSDIERVTMLDATADSAKRFGNLLDPAQVRRLVGLVEESDGAEATAAAALMGALNLPDGEVVSLILQ